MVMFAYNLYKGVWNHVEMTRGRKPYLFIPLAKAKEMERKKSWVEEESDFSPPSCLRSVPGRVALGSPTWRNSQCFCLCFGEEITVPSNPIPTCGDPVVSRGPLGWNRPSLQSQLSLGYLWHGRWAEGEKKKKGLRGAKWLRHRGL